MTDRPILFSAPMVRALIEGGKTQTRRVIKPQPSYIESSGRWRFPIPEAKRHGCDAVVTASREWHEYLLPHQRPWFAVGDRLWVRERFRGPQPYEAHGYKIADWGNKPMWFTADGDPPADREWQFWNKARPSIHMPKWASRITLIIEDVKVERLHEIDGCFTDLEAEGIVPAGAVLSLDEASAAYKALWNTINGDGAWDKNPWVVVYTFSVIPQNIDQIGGEP